MPSESVQIEWDTSNKQSLKTQRKESLMVNNQGKWQTVMLHSSIVKDLLFGTGRE